MNRAQQLAQKKGGRLVTYRTQGRSTWQCGEGHTFSLTLNRVKRGKWCLTCGSSVGERKVREFFRTFGIPFIPQAIFPALPTRRYDYYFEWAGRRYIVEFDGDQHFRYVRKYHKTKGNFYQAQVIDRVKTYVALLYGCHVVRIDQSQREAVAWHILTAINLGAPFYVSSPSLYTHLLQTPVTPEDLRKYAPRLFQS